MSRRIVTSRLSVFFRPVPFFPESLRPLRSIREVLRFLGWVGCRLQFSGKDCHQRAHRLDFGEMLRCLCLSLGRCEQFAMLLFAVLGLLPFVLKRGNDSDEAEAGEYGAQLFSRYGTARLRCNEKKHGHDTSTGHYFCGAHTRDAGGIAPRRNVA